MQRKGFMPLGVVATALIISGCASTSTGYFGSTEVDTTIEAYWQATARGSMIGFVDNRVVSCRKVSQESFDSLVWTDIDLDLRASLMEGCPSDVAEFLYKSSSKVNGRSSTSSRHSLSLRRSSIQTGVWVNHRTEDPRMDVFRVCGEVKVTPVMCFGEEESLEDPEPQHDPREDYRRAWNAPRHSEPVSEPPVCKGYLIHVGHAIKCSPTLSCPSEDYNLVQVDGKWYCMAKPI